MKSIEDQIRVARETTLSHLKFRFMQKWMKDFPCFHVKELKMNNSLREKVVSEFPTVWFMKYDESLDLEDKTWSVEDLSSHLIFDEIMNVYFDSSKERSEENEYSSIDAFLNVSGFNFDELLVAYCAGDAQNRKEWRAEFEKQLTV